MAQRNVTPWPSEAPTRPRPTLPMAFVTRIDRIEKLAAQALHMLSTGPVEEVALAKATHAISEIRELALDTLR